MDKLPKEPPAAEITPPDAYARRREFIKQGALFVAASAAWGTGLVALSGVAIHAPGRKRQPRPPGWHIDKRGAYSTTEEKTPEKAVTAYNNYYELGLRKSDPARNAGSLKPRPWTVFVEGEVDKPRALDVDTLIHWFGLEERVYRMRCVEAWSMVIPWLGFPLAKLIKRLNPTSRARYVQMTTLYDPVQLPGQTRDVLPWPYVEALRMDEAMNPLVILAVGLYGSPLPGQNGAPIRLVVPWKYGFKGAKSIVKIRFTEKRPGTTWNEVAPHEYGFYANVNPHVDHPRWSQATERRIGELGRRKTLMFNGYGEYVADLYKGLDLRKNF